MSRINRQLSNVDSVAVAGAVSGVVLRWRSMFHALGATLFWALLLQLLVPAIVTGPDRLRRKTCGSRSGQ
jgi:hypothetical protein